MATVQQSIDIRVPVHTAYNQLTQFEDYPRFMEEVDAVEQLDDRHLHWKTSMANRPVEWDAEITEQEPDRCIAWHNTSGPSNSARVEVQALGDDSSRVTFTLESEPQQVPGSMAGNTEQALAERLKMDLARLKDFVEQRGSESGAGRGEVRHAQATSPAPTSSYAAGSEGWAGDEDPTAPVTSASGNTGGQAEPVRSPQPGNTAATVGTAGGTDASAGAKLSGSKGIKQEDSRAQPDAAGAPGSPGGTFQGDAISAAAGATTGGTGLGEAASADDARTGTGTSSGSGSALTGAGTSAARDPGKGA